MLDAAGLIEKHRARGVLIDANPLLLFLLGKTNKRRLRDFAAGNAFEIEDFDLLEALVAHLGKLFTTPHVLTEVSNLAKLRGRELPAFRQRYKALVQVMASRYRWRRNARS